MYKLYLKIIILLCMPHILSAKKADENDWFTPKESITQKILILAGHQPNPKTGTGQIVWYHGKQRSLESFLTLRMLPTLQKALESKKFSILTLESKEKSEKARIKRHEQADLIEDENVFALELHFDSPQGSSGVIPGSRYVLSGKNINPYDVCLAEEFGYFSQFHRKGLSGPTRGISLLEVAPLSSNLKNLALQALATKNFEDIDLFLEKQSQRIAHALSTCKLKDLFSKNKSQPILIIVLIKTICYN